MTEMNNRRDNADGLAAEDATDATDSELAALEQKLQDAEAQKRELIKNGWKWHSHDGTEVLAHPDDPEVNIWFHPYSGEQLLSPKLVEWLKNNARDSVQ